MKSPVFGRIGSLNASSSLYAPIQYSISSSWDASEGNVRQVAATSGVLSNFRVVLDGAPGTAASGKGYDFEVYINGVASGYIVSIYDTAVSGVNTGTLSYSAGDTISVRSTPANTPTSRGYSHCFDNESTNQNLFSGGTSTFANNATRYLGLQMSNVGSAALGGIASLMPTNGAIRNARVVHAAAPGTGKSWTWTLVKNGVDTALVVTVSDLATTGSNTTDSVSVVPGDLLYWKIVPTGTPTASRGAIGSEFVPTIPGESIQCHSTTANPSATTANHVGVGAVNASYSTSEASRGNHFTGESYILKKLHALFASAPSAGKSWAVTVRNNASSTPVTITVADAATTGSDLVNEISSVPDSLSSVLIQGSGTPTVGVGYYSFVTYKAPASSGNFLLVF